MASVYKIVSECCRADGIRRLGHWHLPCQILEDQLTLIQPGGISYPPHYYLPLPRIFRPSAGSVLCSVFAISAVQLYLMKCAN